MAWRSEVLEGELTVELVEKNLRDVICNDFKIGCATTAILELPKVTPAAVEDLLRRMLEDRVAHLVSTVHDAIVEALEASPPASR